MNRIDIQRLDPQESFPDKYSLVEEAIARKNKGSDSIVRDARIMRYITDNDLRKHITYSFIINVTFWLSAVISVLYFNNYLLKLQLSDAVLITLLTTSTLNVIGMMTIILKNLFPLQTEKIKSQSVAHEFKLNSLLLKEKPTTPNHHSFLTILF